MPVDDFETWKSELMFTGRIVQDDDETVDCDEAHRRFLRYIELLEQIDGTEGPEAVAALIQSVQMEHDYGAYQTTYRMFARFPDRDFFTTLVQELPALIARQPDLAGDFLVGIANGQGGKWDYQIALFNNAVAIAPAAVRQPIVDYVRSQEPKGWFSNRVGVLCPGMNEPS